MKDIAPFKAAKELQAATPAVLLSNPKFPRNVAAALRACSCYDVSQLWITGQRMAKEVWAASRIPREERMKGYRNVTMVLEDKPFDHFSKGTVPVAIELLDGSENIYGFEHPENAVYVFGPEDGSLNQTMRSFCHRRIFIPTRHCINLSAAVYLVLNDRKQKRVAAGLEPMDTIGESLNESRGWAGDETL